MTDKIRHSSRYKAVVAILACICFILFNGLLSAKKGECIYVGDSEVDVETAKNAGIPCIAVTWGFRDKEALKESGAVHFAADAKELYEKIVELL